MKNLTETQTAYFEILKAASFNDMNGQEIVNDLIQNPEIWERVIPSFTACDSQKEEFKHIEAFTGNIYLDTIYIKTARQNIKRLEYFARKWKADNTQIIEDSLQLEKAGNGNIIFQIWFD